MLQAKVIHFPSTVNEDGHNETINNWLEENNIERKNVHKITQSSSPDKTIVIIWHTK
ncbi:MAG: hypothetical protein V1838_03005 [Patescibacteria group bacterium]